MQIASLLENWKPITDTSKSERTFILKELYTLYTSPGERIQRKKENWKRYVKFLKTIKQGDSKDNQDIFKKGKTFIKEIPENRFWFFVSHIKTADLYFIKSTMQDKVNRGESASAWLFSKVK